MQTTREKILSVVALVALVVGVSVLVAGDVLVPVEAEVQPTVMVIRVIDASGREMAKLCVPPTSQLVVTYEVGGTPTPAPFPKPNPEPLPIPGKRTITILEQAEDRTPAQAAIMTSQTLRAYLESKGHTLKIVDVDALTGNVPSNLPQLRIEDGEGNELFKGALSATVDATLETIKKHGG